MSLNPAQKPARVYKTKQVEGGKRLTWESSDDDDSWTNAPRAVQSLQAACPMASLTVQSQDAVRLDRRDAEIARLNAENANLRSQITVHEDKADNAQKKTAAFSKFARQVLEEYPETFKLVEDDSLLQDKEVLCAALQHHGEKALKRASQELREEIEGNDIRGFCIFCHKPVWCTRDDPNGNRAKRQRLDRKFDYFHDKCNPASSLKCYVYNQPLTGNLHSQYGTAHEGYYHIGGCPKAKPTRE